MKNLLAIFIFLFLLPLWGAGQQNHVPNGNFEYYATCPTSANNVTNCTGWATWNQLTPDYFNACYTTTTTSIGVPFNFRGYQPAASGNGYVGVGTGVTTNVREMITRPIIPLVVGATYEVSLFVSLANASNFGTDDIGIFFYDGSPTYYSVTGVPAIGSTTIVPQVQWPNVIVTDTMNWVKLTQLYVADSAYDNIAIGPFKFGTAINYTQIGSNSTHYAYYYFDSITVRLHDSLRFSFTDTLQCAGNTINVPFYSSIKKQSNNIFRLQLSNASGSFASPVNIGSLTTDTSGTIVGSIPTNTPTGTGYKLRIVSTNFADTSEESVAVKIGLGPVVKPDASNNGPVCAYDTLKLTATTTTSGVAWSWTGPNSFTSTQQNPQIISPLPVNGGDYIVTARLHGCTAKDTTTVVVNAGSGPTGISATTNAPVCADDTLKLYGTANGSGNSYSWSGPNSFTSNQQNPLLPAATSSIGGDYILYASDGLCISKDTVTVVVKPRPANFSAVYNGPLCTGEVINLTASSTSTGVTYAWVGPNSFSSTSATPFIGGSSAVHNGDYIATATLSGCSLKDTVTVNVKPLPAKPTANNNTPLCAGGTLNLTAATSTSGVGWSWTGPGSYSSTAQNPNISNSTTAMSGDYIVTADLNGCIDRDTTTVLIKPTPVPVTLSNNGPLCAGDTLKIFSTASSTGVNYAWGGPNSFTAATQNSSIANSTPAATGWYKMTVDLNGCTYKDSTSVTVYPIPSTPVASYGNPLCVGETLQLSAGNVTGASYSWTGANSFSSLLQNPTRASMQFGDTGTYSVTATVNGCTSPAGNIAVKINPVPFVVILSNPLDSICKGAPVVFNALPNNHGGVPAYQWYVNMQPVSTGVVFSTSTLNNGDIIRCDMTENTKCSTPYKDESNDIQMTVLNWLTPTVSISANPATPLKPNEYVTFTATPANAGIIPKYQWKRNGQNVVGATGAVWSANTLNDNDEICVEITSSYKCPQPLTGMSNCIKVKLLTGIGDMNTNKRIVLYPNPNNGRFVIEAPLYLSPPPTSLGTGKGRGHIDLEIINKLGQVVYTDKTIPANGILRKEIDLGHVAAGVYMLRLHTDDGVTVIRFNVE